MIPWVEPASKQSLTQKGAWIRSVPISPEENQAYGFEQLTLQRLLLL